MQENATHVITVSFVMVPVFMFVTMIVIMIVIARAVFQRFHPMVVVVVMVML
jgi:predicted RND superfamily exporter protein